MHYNTISNIFCILVLHNIDEAPWKFVFTISL